MQIMQSRRDFLASLSVAGAAGVLGAPQSFADEGAPETTTIRIRVEKGPNIVSGVAEIPICVGPQFVAEELLRAEGFTNIRYVLVPGGLPYTQAFERGEIDFTGMFVPSAVHRIDAGVPLTVLAGMHTGCIELFAHEHIRTFTDLKGKQVGINDVPGGAGHLYVSIMAAHVGLDPEKDINWIFTPDDVPNLAMELFVQGKVDAYQAFISQSWELRARKIGRVIVDMAMDTPWSHYFCCMWVGNTTFVREYPVVTKRALRAFLKASDLCSAEPKRAARGLVESGFAQRYDYALRMLTDVSYNVWREFDAEDSVRFYAIWMHEFGDLNSTPNKIIAEGTDWRFLNEIKRELKA